jgi:integrase
MRAVSGIRVFPDFQRRENYSSYHGTAEALIDACVCERSRLPLGAKRGNRDHPHGLKYEGAEWYTRRQPDGTFLHWRETEVARQQRVAESKRWMDERCAESRVFISRLAQSVQRRLSAVRTFMKFLVREGVIGGNPAVVVQAPKAGRPLPDVLDVDQMTRLIEIP